MDLKIKDVAELLNVSESTIRRWISDGKIPVYRINHQYRFSRIEIEDWVMAHKLDKANGTSPFDNITHHTTKDTENPHDTTGGSNQFSLYRAIHKGGTLSDVPGKTKEEIIRSTMNRLAEELDLDAEVITDLLLDREKLQPTALGGGIAVPHTRDFLTREDAIIVSFPQTPIQFGALDGKPVHTLFFLFASDDKRHLHLLAKIAHLSSDQEAVKFLLTKPNKEQLLDYVKKWESNIQKVTV